MKKLLSIFLFAFILPLHSTFASESPQVVVSIKPIHSLVTAIMDGVGTPKLIVKKGSPHGYSLRPSEAKDLARADLVIWVGHELESFLAKPLETLAEKSKKLELSEQLKASLLTKRDGGNWEGSHHHGHDDAHDEDHEEVDLHQHEHDENHEGVHTEQHEAMDLHIWLDPKMAKKIVAATTNMLIEIDPIHTQNYKVNTAKLNLKLDKLDQKLRLELEPIQKTPFLVFHSAYQYFETAYNLNGVGSVTIDPDRKPGAKGISKIRKKVQTTHARCIFSEPQFESSLVATIIEGSKAKTGTLDPLGSDIPAGPDAYFQLMNRLAENLLTGLL